MFPPRSAVAAEGSVALPLSDDYFKLKISNPCAPVTGNRPAFREAIKQMEK